MSKRAEVVANRYCFKSGSPFPNTEKAAVIYGYEQAEKDLGWHSVDESLPEMDEEVIVLKDILVEGGLKVGFGMIAFGHLVDTERCIDYNGWNIPGVKFWMPMPKLPEEQK